MVLTTPTEADVAGNLLLAKLSATDRARLVPHMMVLDMKAGDILHRADEDVLDTWFPCGSAMAAFCVETNDGSDAVEVALVGREGAIGGIVSNGKLPAYATSLVRFSGRLLRIKTSALELAKLESITLRHWFARYSDCLLAQVFQTAACNVTHNISQRTAKGCWPRRHAPAPRSSSSPRSNSRACSAWVAPSSTTRCRSSATRG